MLKLRKWGNSLGIRIPKNIREAINLKENDTLSMTLDGNKITIEKVNKDTVLIDCIDCGTLMKYTCIINGYHQYDCPECKSLIRSNKIRHIK